MTPYYEDDWVTLYHGDCREITVWLEADVLVTDPPYGMTYEGGFGGRRGAPRRRGSDRLKMAGDETVQLRDHVLAQWKSGDSKCFRAALVFGRWNIPKPLGTRQVLVWDKSDNGPGMGAVDLPWGPSHEEVYALGDRGWTGKRRGSVYRVKPLNSQDADRPNHPTPKPIGLMEALVSHTTGMVADPFAGSGTTLLAAKNLGRRAIGVELDERHCYVAAHRLAQDTLFGGAA